MEPRSRTSPEQFFVLIDFMERHGDLSRPQPGPQGRIKNDQLWQKLTNMLNSLGGGVQKSSEKWKKVWADWKTKTKKKCLRLKQQAGSGGGPSGRITALEERVVSVIGSSAVIGQAVIREQGLNRTSSKPVYDAASAVEIPLPLESDKILHILSEGHSENIAVESPPVITCVPTTSQPQQVTIATSASPPSPPSREPLPRSRSPLPRNNRQQASASPLSTSTTLRRTLSRARRNRGLTPFERAADQFAAIERRRLQHEEARDERLHEREMERLRLEADRIAVTREQNSLLHQLSLLGQQLIDVISNKHQPVGS